jgi:hypothetical protein
MNFYLFSLQYWLHSTEWCVAKKEELLVFGDRLCHVLRNYLEDVKLVGKQNVSSHTFFYALWLSVISGAQWLQIPSSCRLLMLLFFYASCFACGCDEKNFPAHSYSVQQMMAALWSNSMYRREFCLLSWLVSVMKTCLLPAVQWDCWLAWEHLQWDSTYYSQHLWCRPSRGPWHSETSSASECMR